MKIKIISDQHLEYRTTPESRQKYYDRSHPLNGEKADICIIAGDLDEIQGRTVAYIQEICNREEQVIYVPGNHDYYGCKSMLNIDEALATIEYAIPNFKVLKTGEVFTYKGKRFLGDTMWYRNNPFIWADRNIIPDYEQIPDLYPFIFHRQGKFEHFLRGNLSIGDIVVTHHLPSTKSTPEFFKNQPTQPFFVCWMEDIIMKYKPSLWIHGHTHSKCDYTLGDTRVICNPLGYPSEGSYEPKALIVEI